MSKADQPTSVRFPRETLDFLRKEATKRRWSISLLVRDVMDQWIRHIVAQNQTSKKDKK